MKKKLSVIFMTTVFVLGITACAGHTGNTSASNAAEKAKFEAINDAVGMPDSYSEETDDGFVFEDIEGGVALFSYDGEEADVVVPEKFEGKSVVELGMSCFSMYMREDSILTSVTLPDSVTVIGESAFGSCYNLTSVNIPNHVTIISHQAFANCTNLESIVIPGSVSTIGDWAFIYCENLKSVDIGDGVTEIGEKAFQHCTSLEQVTIPGSVATVGRWAFDECENLSDVTIEDGVSELADYVFGDCKKLTSVALPDSVTVLGKAFHNCDNIVVTYKGATYTDDNMDDLYGLFEGE